jgi:hypothetical protein
VVHKSIMRCAVKKTVCNHRVIALKLRTELVTYFDSTSVGANIRAFVWESRDYSQPRITYKMISKTDERRKWKNVSNEE